MNLEEYKRNLMRESDKQLLNLKGAEDDFSAGQRSMLVWLQKKLRG